MHRTAQVAIASLVLAALAFLTPSIASAAQQRFTLTLSPVYFMDNTGDSGAPPPPGTIPFYCPNGSPVCPNGSPKTTQNLRLDYGLSYQINRKWSLSYSHSNFDFSLGRILTIAPFSILTGSINDRTDQGTLSFAAGHGLSLDAYYASHQRVQIEAVSGIGLPCYFNSEQCPGNASNPESINSNYWGVGGAYTFGPHSPYQPPMFKVGVDVQYYPRPANGNCAGTNPQPACGSNGINGYVGSGFVYPWSITLFPFSASKLIQPGTIPFLGYEDGSVWFHAENTPETYNIVDAGIVQILPHGLSLSYTYFKLNGRQSSDTIPPPDTIRSATSIFKLTYALHF